MAIAIFATLTVLLLPVVLWKTVGLGQGDVQVFFRAGWALWTGYPLYQVTDHHGWTFHYPPTFALFMAPFANPLPDYPQPVWALPFAAAVAVWYVINAVCLFLALHVWANALERQSPVEAKGGSLQSPWTLQLGPLLALLPFVGDGLVRGQPAPVLLLLVVLYFGLYAEKRLVTAAFAFSLAVAFKVFPLVLAIFPLLRRDWTFLGWTAGWCLLLLVGLPDLSRAGDDPRSVSRDVDGPPRRPRYRVNVAPVGKRGVSGRLFGHRRRRGRGSYSRRSGVPLVAATRMGIGLSAPIQCGACCSDRRPWSRPLLERA